MYIFKRLRLCCLPLPSTHLRGCGESLPLRMASPFETVTSALDRTFQGTSFDHGTSFGRNTSF